MTSGIKVYDIMKKNVVVIDMDAPLFEAARLMKQKNIGSLVVVKDREVKGIVTERDLVRKIIAEKKPYDIRVKEVMSSPAIVIPPDITIEEAAKVMKNKNIRRLPVVDIDSNLVGIISEDDLIRVLPSIIDLIEERSVANY